MPVPGTWVNDARKGACRIRRCCACVLNIHPRTIPGTLAARRAPGQLKRVGPTAGRPKQRSPGSSARLGKVPAGSGLGSCAAPSPRVQKRNAGRQPSNQIGAVVTKRILSKVRGFLSVALARAARWPLYRNWRRQCCCCRMHGPYWEPRWRGAAASTVRLSTTIDCSPSARGVPRREALSSKPNTRPRVHAGAG